jgi:hypothetical protein
MLIIKDIENYQKYFGFNFFQFIIALFHQILLKIKKFYSFLVSHYQLNKFDFSIPFIYFKFIIYFTA